MDRGKERGMTKKQTNTVVDVYLIFNDTVLHMRSLAAVSYNKI